MKHHQIQYIEFLGKDFQTIKKFYEGSFGWHFVDYGPEYMAFSGECVEGGFALGEPKKGSVLVILYSEHLEATKESVKKNGGKIVKDIFEFPGGKRFHFTDPEGNELAVWSDK